MNENMEKKLEIMDERLEAIFQWYKGTCRFVKNMRNLADIVETENSLVADWLENNIIEAEKKLTAISVQLNGWLSRRFFDNSAWFIEKTQSDEEKN